MTQTTISERRAALEAFSRAVNQEAHNLLATDLESLPQFEARKDGE